MTNDIQIYSVATDGNKKLSPHFRVREMACHDGSDTVKVSPETVRLLECIRKHYNFPVVIVSGYRTPSWNRKVGGATRSRHVVGDAADFVVRKPDAGTVSPLEIFEDIDSGKVPGINPKVIGLESYSTFVHIDSRGKKARWQG